MGEAYININKNEKKFFLNLFPESKKWKCIQIKIMPNKWYNLINNNYENYNKSQIHDLLKSYLI